MCKLSMVAAVETGGKQMSTGHLLAGLQIWPDTKKTHTKWCVSFLLFVYALESSEHGTGQICYIFLSSGKKN